MDFKDLVYLDAIDRHRSLTYAAEELYISAGFDKILKKSWEKSWDRTVSLDRSSYGTYRSRKLYLDFAKSVLLQKAELDEKIQSIADVQKSMRVGICFNTRQDILRIKFYAVNAIVFTLFDVQPNTCQPK